MTNRSKRPTRDWACRSCGRPTGSHALCAQCSPRKGQRVHRDKYAPRAITTAAVHLKETA